MKPTSTEQSLRQRFEHLHATEPDTFTLVDFVFRRTERRLIAVVERFVKKHPGAKITPVLTPAYACVGLIATASTGDEVKVCMPQKDTKTYLTTPGMRKSLAARLALGETVSTSIK